MSHKSDPTANPGFMGVHLAGFQALEQRVSGAGSQLEELAHALWVELNKAGVSTQPAMKIYEIAKWLQGKAPELDQRYRVAQQLSQGGNSAFVGSYVKIDESKFGEAAARTQEGQRAADLAQRAAQGDRRALSELLNMKHTDDPFFASALMKKLGADGLVQLPGTMAERLQKLLRDHDQKDFHNTLADNGKLLRLLNKELAVATNNSNQPHLGHDFIDDLKTAGHKSFKTSDGHRYDGYWGLSQVLATTRGPHAEGPGARGPNFGADFIREVGRDMISWDRPRLPMHVPTWSKWGAPYSNIVTVGQSSPSDKHRPLSVCDPLSGLLEAASTNREGAQQLLDFPPRSGKKSNLNYLLHNRRMFWGESDRGNALGHALETAAGGSDDESKRLAVWQTMVLHDDLTKIFKLHGKDDIVIADQKALDALSAMRDSEAAILANQIASVNHAIRNSSERAPAGSPIGTTSDWTGANFSAQDLSYVLLDTTQSEAAFRHILNAQIAFMKINIDKAAALSSLERHKLIREGKITPGNESGMDTYIHLGGEAGSEAFVLANILEARRSAMISSGISEDQQQKSFHDSWIKYVNLGIGFIPVPGSAAIAKKIEEAGSHLTDKSLQKIYEKSISQGYSSLGDKISNLISSGDSKETSAAANASRYDKCVDTAVQQMIEASMVRHGLTHEKLPSMSSFSRNHVLKPNLTYNEHQAFQQWYTEHSEIPFVTQQSTGQLEDGKAHYHREFNRGQSAP